MNLSIASDIARWPCLPGSQYQNFVSRPLAFAFASSGAAGLGPALDPGAMTERVVDFVSIWSSAGRLARRASTDPQASS
ncbi:hypothetical protein [Ramlibacter albus]|uniref:Uncharacterized protein n=1 Tax=Ramlibacter albus TaxID=2079448 RepID=A0A923S3A3_9BURK|nr:hypothetical protein [Ramlibacter albus]MBC5766235.1 hypothetical protein [Ramlibacter albus]